MVGISEIPEVNPSVAGVYSRQSELPPRNTPGRHPVVLDRDNADIIVLGTESYNPWAGSAVEIAEPRYSARIIAFSFSRIVLQPTGEERLNFGQ